MTITSDINGLSPGSLVELFVLDATAIGGSLLRFHPGVSELLAPVVWAGDTYAPYSMEASGFEWSGRGTIPRPHLKAANLTGVITALCLAHADLVGAKLIRKRTMVKYLDAVNFTGGVNPTADPTAQFQDETWYVNRKVGENRVFAEFELASLHDVQGLKLPRRQTIQNICPWAYKGTECGYVPGAMFTTADVATSTPSLDVCGKRLSSCKARFGPHNDLPYGGFPGVGLIR